MALLMVAVPLEAALLTVKLGAEAPSAVSVNVRVPVTAPPFSVPLPDVLPPKVPASSAWATVILITWVSVLPSSSVTMTVKLSLPLKLLSGV